MQDENARLKVKWEKLENILAILESNHINLAQYGRHNNVVFSGVPESVPDNNLDSMVSIIRHWCTSWAKGYWGVSSSWQANFQNTEYNCKIF